MGRKIICYIFSFVRNGQVCCLLTWSKMPSKYFFTNFVFYELALLKNSYLQLTAFVEIVFFKCSAMTFPTAKSAFSSHNWNILDSFCSSKSIQELAIPLYRDYLGRCVWEWSGILWKGDIIGQKALIFPRISIVSKQTLFSKLTAVVWSYKARYNKSIRILVRVVQITWLVG